MSIMRRLRGLAQEPELPPVSKFSSEVRTIFGKSHVLISYDGEPFCRIEPSWPASGGWIAIRNERSAKSKAELFLRKMVV